MIELLNQELADTTDLYSQTKQAHWNVKGIHFYRLHLLFDQLAEKRHGRSRRARRARRPSSAAMPWARFAWLRPTPACRKPDRHQRRYRLRRALVERYGILANNMRAAIDEADKAGDKDTADLFTEISRELDKYLWFLQAHCTGRLAGRRRMPASQEMPCLVGPLLAPDLILINGRIHTVDDANPRATAVAIRDGRFIAVGTDDEVRALAGPATRVEDLGGARSSPG